MDYEEFKHFPPDYKPESKEKYRDRMEKLYDKQLKEIEREGGNREEIKRKRLKLIREYLFLDMCE